MASDPRTAAAATSQAEHDNAIQYDNPMFSKPMTSSEFTGSLQGAMSPTSAAVTSPRR
jgi:hypothetical protein